MYEILKDSKVVCGINSLGLAEARILEFHASSQYLMKYQNIKIVSIFKNILVMN